MLPSRYFLVYCHGVCYRVDPEVAQELIHWMKQCEGRLDAMNDGYTFTTLIGATCTVYAGAIGSIVETSAEIRKAARQLDKDLEGEEAYE